MPPCLGTVAKLFSLFYASDYVCIIVIVSSTFNINGFNLFVSVLIAFSYLF